MFKWCYQCGFGWNQVNYVRIMITHVFFIALTLAGSLRRCLNTLPNGLVFKLLPQIPANVYAWINMCDPYKKMLPTSDVQVLQSPRASSCNCVNWDRKWNWVSGTLLRLNMDWNRKKQQLIKIYLIKTNIGLIATKHVFGVSDKARIKPVSPATELARKLKFRF